MKAVSAGEVKIYNLTAGKTLPEWLGPRRRAALRRDDDFRRRIELIQDFEMPASSTRVRVTPDGQHALLAGAYPPRLRVYDLSQLGVKFERRTDGDIAQALCLGDDWTKLAVLRGTDRTVELHAQFGSYRSVRVPRAARDMLYHAQSCDLCVCGSGSQIFRLNLEQGRFLQPLDARSDALNVCDVCPAHALLAFGGDSGLVECFDPRTRSAVAAVDVAAECGGGGGALEVTALTFCSDGLTLGVGTSAGHCLLYDLRAPRPYASQNHRNGTPITSMRFHESVIDGRTRVLSCDRTVLRVWDKHGGDDSLLFAFEPSAGGDLAEVSTVGNSGMLFLAGDFPRAQILYVPALGPAPRWCSFLDNLTEEMEEAAPNVYADFKFVTKQELAQLGLDRLIGTPYLRAYMHGYFVDMRAYKRVREVVDPFAYDRYRAELLRSKLDAKTSTRIHARTQLPKVNAAVAERLAAAAAASTAGEPGAKRPKKAPSLLTDDRFSAMFTNEDFAITSAEAEQAVTRRSAHGSVVAAAARDDVIEEEDGFDGEDDGEVLGEDEDDERMEEATDLASALGRQGTKAPPAAGNTKKAARRAASAKAAASRPLEVRAEELAAREQANQARQKQRGPRVLGSGSGVTPGQREMSFIPEKEQRQAKAKKQQKQAARRVPESRQQRIRRLQARREKR